MMMHAVVEYTCWLYHVCVCMYVLYECGETVGMVRMCVRHSACMSGVRREKKLSLYKPVLCSLTQNPIRSKRAKKKKRDQEPKLTVVLLILGIRLEHLQPPQA